MGKKGLTLMEIVTVMAAGGAVLFLVSAAAVESLRTWRREEAGFSAWSSGERFASDFRRDLRRAVPGGVVLREQSAYIEFTADVEGSSFIAGTVRYSTEEHENGTAAVREESAGNGLAAPRVYEGVKDFSIEECGEFSGLYRLEAHLRGAEGTIRESIHSPATGKGYYR